MLASILPHSKKIAERKIAANLETRDISVGTMLEIMRQINQWDEKELKEALSPLRQPDGRYITNEKNLDKWIDPRIFRETQVKRFLRWLTTSPPVLNIFFTWLFIKMIGMKLAYFDQQESQNPEALFKQDLKHEITRQETEHFTIHNLGHATQLIQTSGMNILTDPVFGDLAPLIYPSMTKKFKQNYQANDLPAIDVILISHNHRDHVDVDSLKQLIKKTQAEGKALPQVLVPMGDEAFFKELGFEDVRAFEWHEEITLSSQSGELITFCSAPADHRSGRKGHDSHRSLVMGWTISPKNKEEILYFAGDTARISDRRMDSLALDIYQLYKNKQVDKKQLPKLINMEPGGPNYTRQDMKPTHQSAVDSIISAFRLAIALSKIGPLANDANYSAANWLDATTTVFMHQNKYELGPDRFNENVFIYTRLLSYLQMNDEELEQHQQKQKKKSKDWSLFHRRKDFIIDGVRELRNVAKQIWPGDEPEQQNRNIIDFIRSRVHFPLINEKVSSEDVFQFKAGEVSTIIPNTNHKGNKESVSPQLK